MLIMKKIAFASILFFLGITTYGHLSSISKDNEDRFLRKSKKQNNKAAVYIGIGSLALAAGIPMYNSSSNLDDAVVCCNRNSFVENFCRAKKRVKSLAFRKQAINIQLRPNNYLPTQITIVLRLNLAK